MSNLKIAALMIATAVATAFIWNGLHDDTVVQTRVEVIEKMIPAPPSPQAEPEVGPPLNASTSPSGAPLVVPVKTNDLGMKLVTATNIKSFVLEALKQPEKGGAFYATMALKQCSADGFADMKDRADRAIKKVVDTESTISQERQAAIEGPLKRCVGFSEGEVGALMSQAAKLGRDGTDPLLRMATSIARTPPGTPEREKALEDIYKSGNSALISEAFIPTRYIQAATIWGKGESVTIKFNGQTYGQEDYVVVMAASVLGACTEGDYCALDQRRLDKCWGLGECYANRDEFVRHEYFKGDEVAFEKAALLAQQIKESVARGDTSIFR